MAKRNPGYYEVIVQNIGKVWEGSNGFTARTIFQQYVGKSKRGIGRAAGESVDLFKNDDVIKTYLGTQDNPATAKLISIPARNITINPSTKTVTFTAPKGTARKLAGRGIRVGRQKNPSDTFKELHIGDKFIFEGETKYLSFARGP